MTVSCWVYVIGQSRLWRNEFHTAELNSPLFKNRIHIPDHTKKHILIIVLLSGEFKTM